jgi:hypothetical protein
MRRCLLPLLHPVRRSRAAAKLAALPAVEEETVALILAVVPAAKTAAMADHWHERSKAVVRAKPVPIDYILFVLHEIAVVFPFLA